MWTISFLWRHHWPPPQPTFLFISSYFIGFLESIWLGFFSPSCPLNAISSLTLIWHCVPQKLEIFTLFILTSYANIPVGWNGIPFINKVDIALSETFQSVGVGSYLVKNIKPYFLAHIPKIHRKQCDWY